MLHASLWKDRLQSSPLRIFCEPSGFSCKMGKAKAMMGSSVGQGDSGGQRGVTAGS